MVEEMGKPVYELAKVQEDMAKIDTFLLDLDGTVYLGDQLFSWSLGFLDKVKALGKQFIFVTNNSSRNGKYYVQKLTKLGVPISDNQIFTSGEATIYYLKKQQYRSDVCVIGTPDLEAEFKQAGFTLTRENPSAVVLGFDLTLTYEKLRVVCDLVRSGVPFIATHPDFNCPTPEGPIPDCGAMIAAVTASTGKEPIIIGKPYPAMVDALRAKFGLDKDSVAMIGDRLYTDIAMGRAAGIKSILVLSGETQLADLSSSDDQPDLVADNLGEITNWL